MSFDFSRQSVAVNHYYFYVQDPEWGPAFLKFGTYLPYPIKLCLNGHEWVKQQLRRAHVAFDSLDNGFLACADPTRLQAICDQLGPADVQAFFDRWTARLARAADSHRSGRRLHAPARAAASGGQPHAGVCPARAGPPLLRSGDPRESGPRPAGPRRSALSAPPHAHARRRPAWGYRTRVITDGVEPSLHIEYKSSHVKQYFKEQRALRTETTINNPTDFYVAKAVRTCSHLRDLGNQVNRKLLEVERVSHHCVLTQDALDRLQRPTVEAGQRTSALRFGDPRVMALFQALSGFTHLPRGFRNRDLRPPVEALARSPVLRRPDDLRPATAATQRADPSHPEDASLHRHDLRAQGGLLLRQALFAHPAARRGPLCCPRTISCRARFAPPSTNSTRPSNTSTRRRLLLPEKLASTVTTKPLESV